MSRPVCCCFGLPSKLKLPDEPTEERKHTQILNVEGTCTVSFTSVLLQSCFMSTDVTDTVQVHSKGLFPKSFLCQLRLSVAPWLCFSLPRLASTSYIYVT